MQKTTQPKKIDYDEFWKEKYPDFVDSNIVDNAKKLREIKRIVEIENRKKFN